jgi:Ca2+-binding EF-hand superfamily protein
LRAIFHVFDTDNCGFIKAEDLHNAFEKLGQEIDKHVIEEMIA